MELLNQLQASIFISQNDLFLIAAFIGLVLIFMFLLGRENLLTTLVCIYIALAIVSFIPEIENGILGIRSGNSFQLRALFFTGLVVVLYFLLTPTSIRSEISENVETWQFSVISIITVGLFSSIILSLMPAAMLDNFSETVHILFLNMWSKMFWLLTGLFFIAYLSREE